MSPFPLFPTGQTGQQHGLIPPVPAPVPSFQQGGQMPLAPPSILFQINRVTATFPTVTHRHIVEAAGKEMKDLPKLDGKTVCFLALLGTCTYPRCSFFHLVDVAKLTPQFLKEWEEIVTQGVEKILADGKLPDLKKKKRKQQLQK